MLKQFCQILDYPFVNSSFSRYHSPGRVTKGESAVFSTNLNEEGLGEVSEYSLFAPIISSPIAVGDKLLIGRDQLLVCLRD